MKVTLIATVLNAVEYIGGFLESVAAQTRRPDEVVVVDGGSTDGTLEILRAADGVTVLEAPGANIARGRNVALATATHECVAVADADCEYGSGWLAALVEPLEAGADVAMGFTEPIVEGFWAACLAAANLPMDPAEVDPATFMPSARSLACRREAIEAIGGWPEWLAIGEDMWVDHRWRERGFDLRFTPEAVARWRLRSGPVEVWTQYFRYARGDAQAGMYPERHALRFAIYAGLAVTLASRKTWPKVAVAVGGAAYARRPLQRAFHRIPRPGERGAAAVAVPLTMLWLDLAKMAGYLAGLADRLTGRIQPPSAYS